MIPHSLVGIVAAVIVAGSTFTFKAIPQVPMCVRRTQCMWAFQKPTIVSATYMLDDSAEFFCVKVLATSICTTVSLGHDEVFLLADSCDSVVEAVDRG